MLYNNIGKKALTGLVCLSAIFGAGCSAGTTAETNTTTSAAEAVTSAYETQAESAENVTENKKIKIVCTIFPEYDWVRQVLGDNIQNAEINYLLSNGVDLHNYQPTAADMMSISECDLFIYVGGESDGWVEDALKNAVNKDMKVISLMDVMGDRAKAEELKEGMQEDEHDHDHDHGHKDKHVSTFEDDEVQDRALSDWDGDWQSAYPLVLDGSLDKAWEHKSEDGSMTAEEYKEYYTKGYKSDYDAISIHDGHIKFTDNKGVVTESDYEYTGYYIQNWSTGTKAAMYRFEAVDKESGAPVYIEFNDHMIEPEKAEHFHIRMSNESYDAIVDPEGNWPTFFDAALDAEGVCDEVIGHDHNDDEDEEHDHDHDEDEGHHHEDGEELDEHVWLSLSNARVFCREISDDLCEIDPDNADMYRANLEAYDAQLSALDDDIRALVDSSSSKTLIFGDRFPFRYFVDDYGLDYYAAFIGCSAESEASFETIAFLSDKVNELDADTVYIIENSDGKIADSIISASGADCTVAVLDSAQSVSAEDIEGGKTYLGIMQSNYDALRADIAE